MIGDKTGFELLLDHGRVVAVYFMGTKILSVEKVEVENSVSVEDGCLVRSKLVLHMIGPIPVKEIE